MQKSIKDESETIKLASEMWGQFAKNRNKAVIFALEGPLGSGKTTFTKALAREAEISDTVVSPTFVLHREYPGFDHVDAWRIENFSEVISLGLNKMIEDNHVIVIEWADKFKNEIADLRSQASIVWIKFVHIGEGEERSIEYEYSGN